MILWHLGIKRANMPNEVAQKDQERNEKPRTRNFRFRLIACTIHTGRDLPYQPSTYSVCSSLTAVVSLIA